MTELSFEQFQKLALRTESKVESSEMDVPGIKMLLEMFIIIGTLLDYTKKGVFYNNYTKYDENFLDLSNKLNDLMLKYVTDGGNRSTESSINFRIFHGLLGTITESSELAMVLLKYLETGEVDKVNVGEEFADSDWYKAIAFDELGLEESVTRQNVIEKLRVRFPDKYSDDAAANRNLDAEREQLAKGIV